jgi:2-polyprenyl-3-methyl-5-hydroxy-6-metoxy-1,4-benzoquinol methylase
MPVRDLPTGARAARPPRVTAWLLLLASAAAVLLVGVVATALVFGTVGVWEAPPVGYWPRLLAACALTLVSLSLRSLRWIYLLRRAETRIPIRDAYVGYLAGLSLLFTPLLLGEITLRAFLNRARGGVPIVVTGVVNLWERAMDVLALGLIASGVAVASGTPTGWHYACLGGVMVTLVPAVRRGMLSLMELAVSAPARAFEAPRPVTLDRLTQSGTWLTGMATSIVAWTLPGLGLWVLAGAWLGRPSVSWAEQAYAWSAAASSLTLTPGGVLVAGARLLESLADAGIAQPAAVLIVLGIRLATAGLSVALGIVFVVVHARTKRAPSETHFDDIADAYDVQIPESRREALLAVKTALMRDVLASKGRGRRGPRGLDIGCGQGAYVARMQALGFDVSGIDMSAGQVRRAMQAVADPGRISIGSVLAIPATDESFDFLYVVNVLHHLESVAAQQHAFDEMLRVLKPGGLIFVHEINTRNVLFRFYMGYVFPSLNCIDEGVERWLLPDRLAQYTKAPVVEVRYFTFLPDFVPAALVRLLRPIERLLEGSFLRVYSAHYMAVLEKEGPRG